jgi:hypothetical protein
MNNNPNPGYSSYEPEVLLDNFEKLLPLSIQIISDRKDEATAERVVGGARLEFEKLMPELPYVGDARYPLPQNLIQSAVALSYYRSLVRTGMNSEQAGTIVSEVAEASARAVPEEQLLALGEMQFKEEWYQMQRKFAAKSQERRYPGDWVVSFVEGVPGEFDWGYDFTECAILKLFKSQGAEELVPYLCKLDFIISKLQNTGLHRTKTLATGGDCCDFRYKKGRDVQIPL